VQVYLTDPSQTNLILQSGTGSVGVELVGRGHHLLLNTASINGRAATEKQPVIISNTSEISTFKPNPLLPDTRSEMAVPLLIGEKVVGVLDMQSKVPGSLNLDILPAFEALAGQLAIAIQNASLLAETEAARVEVEKQARRLVRAGWDDYLDAIHKPEHTGFVFERDEILPLVEEQPVTDPNAISAPIAVTGESLGSLVVELAEENKTPQNIELVNAVARQVSQQIESLRLLDSAERYRAEAEGASHRLTREGWKNYTDANADKGLSYIYDLKEVRTYHQIEDQQAEESAFSLPLKVRDETVGRLVVQGLGADDTESLELANAVAERLGAHIESLRQFDQTQSALAQSEKLFEASRALTQAQDLQELTASTASLLGIPQINRAVLATFNYDPENNIDSLDVLANWWNGTGQEVTAVGTHYPLEVIRAMSFFVSPTPVFFNDTFTDPRADETTLQLAKRLNLRAVAVLPLYSGTRQIGALILEAEEPHTFTNEETRLFSALAPQIATVLENRRQFEQAQKQAKRESTLNTISQKIQGATSVEAVLQIAARELGHALGAPMTIAQLGMKEPGNDGK
jgi:GAF domain-containing protein